MQGRAVATKTAELAAPLPFAYQGTRVQPCTLSIEKSLHHHLILPLGFILSLDVNPVKKAKTLKNLDFFLLPSDMMAQ